MEHNNTQTQSALPIVTPKHPDDKVWDGSFLWVCTTFLIILLMFSGLRMITNIEWIRNLNPLILEFGFSFLSQIVIMAGVPFLSMWLFWRRKKTSRAGIGVLPNKPKILSSFGFDKPTWRVIGFAFLMGFLIYFFNIFVAGVFNGVLNIFGYRFPSGIGSPVGGVGGLFLSLFLIAVLPGICEEVTHRGMLMKSFSSKIGIMRAMLFSSVLFGFMHLNIVQVFYAAILGYIIALAVVATRSLWVGIIMHFMNNALGTYFSIAGHYGWPGGNFLVWIMNLGGGIGVAIFIALAIASYYIVMRIIHMFARENFYKNKTTTLAQIAYTNPSVLKTKTGETMTLVQLDQRMEEGLQKMPRWFQTCFFLDPVYTTRRRMGERPTLTPAERTMFYGTMFLGGIITLFTLVWGLL